MKCVSQSILGLTRGQPGMPSSMQLRKSPGVFALPSCRHKLASALLVPLAVSYTQAFDDRSLIMHDNSTRLLVLAAQSA